MVQLRIQYDRIADGTVEYTMRTVVEQTTTEPDPLKTCLVVRKGDAGANEYLARVGTYAEVVDTPLNPLPPNVDLFYSPSLSSIVGGIQAGDLITVVVPFMWEQHFGVIASYQVEVVNPAVATNTVSVTPVFPAFARNLEFIVTRPPDILLPVPATPPATTPPNPTDGVANRDFSAYPGIDYFLTDDHADTWTDIDDADGRFTALQIEAQSLVDETNQDNYTGQTDEVYS